MGEFPFTTACLTNGVIAITNLLARDLACYSTMRDCYGLRILRVGRRDGPCSENRILIGTCASLGDGPGVLQAIMMVTVLCEGKVERYCDVSCGRDVARQDFWIE